MLLFLMSLRHNNYSSKSKKSEFFSNTKEPLYLLTYFHLCFFQKENPRHSMQLDLSSD